MLHFIRTRANLLRGTTLIYWLCQPHSYSMPLKPYDNPAL